MTLSLPPSLSLSLCPFSFASLNLPLRFSPSHTHTHTLYWLLLHTDSQYAILGWKSCQETRSLLTSQRVQSLHFFPPSSSWNVPLKSRLHKLFKRKKKKQIKLGIYWFKIDCRESKNSNTSCSKRHQAKTVWRTSQWVNAHVSHQGRVSWRGIRLLIRLLALFPSRKPFKRVKKKKKRRGCLLPATLVTIIPGKGHANTGGRCESGFMPSYVRTLIISECSCRRGVGFFFLFDTEQEALFKAL